MINPFEDILTGKNYREVLNSALSIAPAVLQQVASQIGDEQFPEIATYTVDTCRGVGVHQTLVQGGMLHLFSLAVDTHQRREFFGNLLEDLNLSRTQAFRSLAVWRHFGCQLLNAGQLQKRFCSESLKILAEDRTPDTARAEALVLAESGHKITIQIAEQLLRQHGVVLTVSEPDGGPTAPARRTSKKWLFAGTVVRIQLTPTKATEVPDVPSMIRDLEAAISELRNRERNLVA